MPMDARTPRGAHAMGDQHLESAASRLQQSDLPAPDVALIVGSGLGGIANALEPVIGARYDELPGFSRSTVAGHSGRVDVGLLEGTSCVVFQGRAHLYEGRTMAEVTFPVRLASRLGARLLLTTNSAGGISSRLTPGSLMLIAGHISIPPLSVGRTGNPRGADAYREDLLCMVEEVALRERVLLKRGTYGWVLGPSYETPAEIRALRTLGADAVGMSTVPEILQAHALGMTCVAISSITNYAAGLQARPLNHDEVLAAAYRISASLETIIRGLLRRRSGR